MVFLLCHVCQSRRLTIVKLPQARRRTLSKENDSMVVKESTEVYVYKIFFRMTVYLISIWLHILAAATWIGAMVFFAAVVVPLLRRDELRAHAPMLIRSMGARYRVLGWISLVVLIVTGVANLYFRGISVAVLSEARFFAQGFGKWLAWKLALVLVVLVLTVLHEVVVGKGALNAFQHGNQTRAERARRAASWIGRTTMLVSLAIVWFAVLMVRGCA